MAGKDGRSSGKPRERKVNSGSVYKLKFLSEEERAFYAPLGIRLREMRVAAGYKQIDLAAILGVSLSHISDIENAYSKISAQELYKYCIATHADPNEILGFPKNGRQQTTAELDEKIKMMLSSYTDHDKMQLLAVMRCLSGQGFSEL